MCALGENFISTSLLSLIFAMNNSGDFHILLDCYHSIFINHNRLLRRRELNTFKFAEIFTNAKLSETLRFKLNARIMKRWLPISMDVVGRVNEGRCSCWLPLISNHQLSGLDPLFHLTVNKTVAKFAFHSINIQSRIIITRRESKRLL